MRTPDFAEVVQFNGLPREMRRVSRLHEKSGSLEKIIGDPDSSIYDVEGQHIRSKLVIATAKAVGGKIHMPVIRAAAALELVQDSSLYADDFMDNASIRRGTAALHVSAGTGPALMAAFFTNNAAYEELSHVNTEAVGVVARAVQAMCVGQTEEWKSKYQIDRTVEDYNSATDKKTGSLFSAACQVGPIATGISVKDPKVKALGRFGENLGRMYQGVDNYLDLTSTPELLGKPAGSDIREGVYNLPVIYGLESSRAAQIKPWLGREPTVKVVDMAEVVEVLFAAGAMERALEDARKNARDAADSLADLPENPVVDGLRQLPEAMLNSLLQKQSPGYIER